MWLGITVWRLFKLLILVLRWRNFGLEEMLVAFACCEINWILKLRE